MANSGRPLTENPNLARRNNVKAAGVQSFARLDHLPAMPQSLANINPFDWCLRRVAGELIGAPRRCRVHPQSSIFNPRFKIEVVEN